MNLESVMKRCRRDEGVVQWMYLDGANPPNVTVGEGHLIPDAAHAQKLGFLAGNRLATATEVAAEFGRVAALPRGRTPQYYKAYTTLRLPAEHIDAILAGDIADREAAIRAQLPAFDSWPEPVQEAVFDIAFNVGVGGLLRFRRMLAAIAEHDWQAAAVQSHRNGISEDRNKEIAALFSAVADKGEPVNA
jgi:GH24 family phage-related lysozyme (muramidase)